MKRISTIAAVALSLTFALTACGSDGGDKAGDSNSDTISKADFLEQGNAICEKGNAELADIGASIDPTDPEAASTVITDELVPNVRAQIESLRALGYPDGDKDTLETIYTGAEADLDSLESDPSALFSGEDPFAETNTALVDYGLTVCGSS